MSKSPQLKEKIMSRRQQHRRYLRTVAEAWNLQNILGGFNHAENPLRSEAWQELDLGEVFRHPSRSVCNGSQVSEDQSSRVETHQDSDYFSMPCTISPKV